MQQIQLSDDVVACKCTPSGHQLVSSPELKEDNCPFSLFTSVTLCEKNLSVIVLCVITL